MKRPLFVAVLTMAACYNAQQSSCGTGPSPIPEPRPTPFILVIGTPTPSPTPSPLESCRIDYMILRPDSFVLPINTETTAVDLTPYQTVITNGQVSQIEVSAACNQPRANLIVWTSSSPAVVVTFGFNPIVRRVGNGVATITATLEGRVSNPIIVR